LAPWRAKVQLRYQTKLTFEDYVRAQAWLDASLDECPVCAPGKCRPEGHGTYMRKVPGVSFIARFRCTTTGATIGMLPDFFASRMPGTLPDLEEAVARTESSPSIEAAANELRPADVEDAVTLPTAIRWVRLRLLIVRATLATVKGLLPELFEGCAITVRAFRERLGVGCALMELRAICERHLHHLPPPLGLVPPPDLPDQRWKRYQQSSGPDPPPAKA
jgi:hypothetical protein